MIILSFRADNTVIPGLTRNLIPCHLTDDEHLYTEIPLFPTEDGKVRISLWNNSIAVMEF
jgi:hypothetical protein